MDRRNQSRKLHASIQGYQPFADQISGMQSEDLDADWLLFFIQYHRDLPVWRAAVLVDEQCLRLELRTTRRYGQAAEPAPIMPTLKSYDAIWPPDIHVWNHQPRRR